MHSLCNSLCSVPHTQSYFYIQYTYAYTYLAYNLKIPIITIRNEQPVIE